MRFTVQFHDRQPFKRRSAYLENLVEYIKVQAPVALGISAQEDEGSIYVFIHGAEVQKLTFLKTKVGRWEELGDRVLEQLVPPEHRGPIGGPARRWPTGIPTRTPGEVDDAFRKRMMRKMMGK